MELARQGNCWFHADEGNAGRSVQPLGFSLFAKRAAASGRASRWHLIWSQPCSRAAMVRFDEDDAGLSQRALKPYLSSPAETFASRTQMAASTVMRNSTNSVRLRGL
jgi:hypothetical protein